MWGRASDSKIIDFPTTRIYLNVPYQQKDSAKAKGARWDAAVKKWYYTNPQDADKFTLWMEKPFMKYEDLTDEQQELIDRVRTGENVLVDACIGSGKTSTIQVLCNEIQDKKILYLTYNNLLKLDAQSKIHQSNTTVTNYHGFANACLNRKGIRVNPSEMIQEFLKQKPPLGGNYDILILDEYQDIEQEIAEMLEYIKSKNPQMQIVAVGDMKQKIYDKTTLDVLPFVCSFLGEYTLLSFTKCFRLNEEHAAYLGGIWEKEINGVNKDCKVEKMNFMEVIDVLGNLKPSDILCLGARTGEMADMLNILERRFPQKFNKQTVYASIVDEDRRTCRPSAENAIFTTFDSSKGLERKVCCVFDFTDSYWFMRGFQPNVKYEILRNIFLVAASRGKERIIFVNSRKGTLLTDDILGEPIDKEELDALKYMRPFMMSDMFSFKYKEDVEECYSFLKVQKIQADDESVIEVNTADGLIDLSPCVGIWQEASFFEKYNIDEQIEFEKEGHPDRPEPQIKKGATLDDKILALTAFSTCYQRYVTQVKPNFISEAQKRMIHDRLRTEFDGTEEVQGHCGFASKGVGKNPIYIEGKFDVIKNNTIWELKFINEIGHEEFLQLACYILSHDMSSGVIWNVRTNEKYKVSIPAAKKKAFLNAVLNCITKGDVTEYIPLFASQDISKSKKKRDADNAKLDSAREAALKKEKAKAKARAKAKSKKSGGGDAA